MSYVFVLLFFAAIVGIFKPFIAGLKRWHFAGAAVVAFILVGVTAPQSSTSESASPTSKDASGPLASTPAETQAPTEPSSKWDYSSSRDDMRGTTTKLASIQSENSVDLDFPYGEVHGRIWIRQRPEDGLNIAFEVENGQVLCNSFSQSYVSIKFDDGPIQKLRCTDASDGSTETAFIEDERRVLNGLKSAKRTVVEAEFFQQGRQQFVFETDGLKWQ